MERKKIKAVITKEWKIKRMKKKNPEQENWNNNENKEETKEKMISQNKKWKKKEWKKGKYSQ